MPIFLYAGSIRNQEIESTLVWVFPNIWIKGQVRNTTFGSNVSNEILLNAIKCKGATFNVSELLKENQQG